MIRSCKGKETAKFWNRFPSRKFKSIENTARIKLALLDAAISLRDLSFPGLRLEKLRRPHWAVQHPNQRSVSPLF
jgi:plasmid maintenance system killer protein